MKRFIMGLTIGILIGTAITVFANGSYFSSQTVLNRVFDKTNNYLKAQGY